MKLKHTTKVPKPVADRLNVIIVSDGNAQLVKDFVKDGFNLDIKVNADAAEKGAENIFMDGTRNLLLIGIGKPADEHEALRRAVSTSVSFANDHKFGKVFVAFPDADRKPGCECITAMAEALPLSNYQFLTYKTNGDRNTLKEGVVWSATASDKKLVVRGEKIARATMIARDLVNEPVITLSATELANRAKAFGKEFGFKVTVLNKQKIQALKMGGLLAVNTGSPEPPTFTIMEYKPKNAQNAQPAILVGKGVVYDTGGLSLKPTPNSMDIMKSDMAGSAAVIGTMCAVAALELPIHVIGLVPATDNRPGGNAYAPGDVITMYDGTTVEVLNTDAEGRLILADALHYAKKYNPALVIDLATLTGAQIIAIGYHGLAMMGTADAPTKARLSQAGNRVYERVVELPLWEEYKEQLKSDIADISNLGGRPGGSITAGKFLEHFTDYPWIHLDIAGPSFLPTADSYRGKNGTGVGVRLLTEFLGAFFK